MRKKNIKGRPSLRTAARNLAGSLARYQRRGFFARVRAKVQEKVARAAASEA
jgi:hypothetical protein